MVWDDTAVRILRIVANLGGRASDVAIHLGCSKKAVHSAAERYGVRFRERRAA